MNVCSQSVNSGLKRIVSSLTYKTWCEGLFAKPRSFLLYCENPPKAGQGIREENPTGRGTGGSCGRHAIPSRNEVQQTIIDRNCG
jgi:hypothetical protein